MRPASTILVITLCAVSATACASRSTTRETAGRTTVTSIGVARMEADGTIVLQLRAVEGGTIGEGFFRYPKDHPEYAAVLKHVGGLQPGESKPVPPWPDGK